MSVRSSRKNNYKKEILFYITALVCMLTMAAVQPFGEGPDEINRYRVVEYICENATLPRGDDPAVLIPGYGGSYAFQPMLTYIIEGYLLVIVRAFTDRFEILLFAARLVNVAFGMGAAVCTRKLSRLLFPEEIMQWLFSFLVVFLPQSIFIHTYVNTDSCAVFSVLLMFFFVLQGMRDGYDRKNCTGIALGVILCMLSYYNAYGAILVTACLFIAHFMIHISARTIAPDGTAFPIDRIRVEWGPLLKGGAYIALLTLAGAGWWFIRNAFLYQGDFLGLTARNICAAATSTPDYHPLLKTTWQGAGESVFSMVFETDYYTLLRRSFVAMYGPMNLPTHYYIYETYYKIFRVGLIVVLLPAGYDLYLVWLKRNRRFFFNFCMLVACIIPIFLCVYYSYTWDYQPQGRYLMPMLPAFMYLITLGIRKAVFLLSELFDRLKCRFIAGCLPHLIGGLLLGFVAAALIYTVFVVAVPHYVMG